MRRTQEPKADGFAAKRLAQFPDHSFSLSNGKLFCQACCVELSMRKCTLVKHVTKSRTHARQLQKWINAAEHKKQTIDVRLYPPPSCLSV